MPTKRSIPALEDLPKSMRMAIAKVMTEFKLDYPEALDRAAMLIDVNCPAFERAVNGEAERRFKSRFMTQLNKGRSTIEENLQSRINIAFKNGEAAGYSRAKSEFGVWYNCVVCGQPLYITPNSEPHRLVNDYLRSRRWGHIACHEKR